MSMKPRIPRESKSTKWPSLAASLCLAASTVTAALVASPGLAQLGDGGSQTWNQGVVPSANQFANESFASTFAVGDFNGDGYQDLAVGESNGTVDGDENAGQVHVFYYLPMSEAFWPSRIQTFDLSQWLTGGSNFTDSIFGRSLAAGDFDNDGYDDLAIGAPLADIEASRGGTLTEEAGVVCIIYGSASDLEISDRQVLTDQNVDANEWFGWSLAAGDFDGDGRADLAVGVPRADVAIKRGVEDAGAIRSYVGSDGGLVYDQLTVQESFGQVSESFDWFGQTLATGDFNRDGFDDLAVGAHQEDVGALFDAGAVYVLNGDPGAVFDDFTGLAITQSAIAGTVAEEQDRFGFSLVAGDFNGNGFDDLAVGAPDEDIGSIVDAGVVVVLAGTVSGVTAASPLLIEQGDAGAIASTEAGDRFGAALVSGDFNADGFDELIVGATGEDLDSNTVSNAGAAVRFFGTAGGVTTAGADLWTQSSPIAAEVNETDDFASSTLAAGDFNGDGTADLILGIPSEDDGGSADTGAFIVYYSGGLQIFRDGFESGDTAGWSSTAP